MVGISLQVERAKFFDPTLLNVANEANEYAVEKIERLHDRRLNYS